MNKITNHAMSRRRLLASAAGAALFAGVESRGAASSDAAEQRAGPAGKALGASGFFAELIISPKFNEDAIEIIGSDIEDIRIVAEEEALAVDYYRPDDAADLADKLIALARDPERERQMAEQNYAAARELTMPHIVAQYLSDFRESSEGAALPPCVLPEDPAAAA